MHNFFKTEKTNAEIKKDGGIKLMKLLSAILIITAMVFSMTACGNNADANENTDRSGRCFFLYRSNGASLTSVMISPVFGCGIVSLSACKQ